jgi:hypothetical protein
MIQMAAIVYLYKLGYLILDLHIMLTARHIFSTDEFIPIYINHSHQPRLYI